jgi:hypothetical protein
MNLSDAAAAAVGICYYNWNLGDGAYSCEHLSEALQLAGNRYLVACKRGRRPCLFCTFIHEVKRKEISKVDLW